MRIPSATATTPRRTTVLRRRCDADRFTIIPNDTVRDSRLSFAARGVLAEMLSRPDDWQFSADRIATGSERDGRKLVLRCLRELESAGYVMRYTERREGGKFATVVMVSDLPVEEWKPENRAASTQAGEPAGGTEGPSGNDGGRDAREGTTKEITSTKTENEEDKTCLQLASLAGGENSFDPSLREQDRQLFAELLGGNLETNRSKWKTEDPNARVFTPGAFYNAFRKKASNPVKWPGQWLQQIDDNDGLDDWLIDEGLTVVH